MNMNGKTYESHETIKNEKNKEVSTKTSLGYIFRIRRVIINRTVKVTVNELSQFQNIKNIVQQSSFSPSVKNNFKNAEFDLYSTVTINSNVWCNRRPMEFSERLLFYRH